MNKNELVYVLALCLIAGCSSAVDGDPETAQVTTSDPPGSNADPVEPEPAADETLIRGTVVGSFPATTDGECSPMGIPITFFLTGIFGLDALVSETVSHESETRCAVEQVLEAPADSWGSLAYTICGGGDDPSLCGAQATRLCSVNIISQWASVRAESVSVSDSTFGFTYTLAPQDGRARTALYERGLQELDTLIAESAAIIDEYSAGTRDCPNENYDEILATAARAEELR